WGIARYQTDMSASSTGTTSCRTPAQADCGSATTPAKAGTTALPSRAVIHNLSTDVYERATFIQHWRPLAVHGRSGPLHHSPLSLLCMNHDPLFRFPRFFTDLSANE